ncbi:MAG: ABC transporter substrate-binding protein, partial [Trebonia sp.]
GQSIDADLRTLAPKYGLTYLGVKYFNEGAQDMVSQVSALKNADAIFVSGNATDAGVIAASAKQVGYKGTLVGNNGLQGYTYVEGSNGAANGTIFASNNLDYDTSIPASQWPTAYRDHVNAVVKQFGVTTGPKSGVKEFKGTAPAGDCVAEWAAAVRSAGTFDSTKVAQTWQTMSFTADQIPSGIPVKFTPTSHDEYQGPAEMFIYQWVKTGSQSWTVKQLQAAS